MFPISVRHSSLRFARAHFYYHTIILIQEAPQVTEAINNAYFLYRFSVSEMVAFSLVAMLCALEVQGRRPMELRFLPVCLSYVLQIQTSTYACLHNLSRPASPHLPFRRLHLEDLKLPHLTRR